MTSHTITKPAATIGVAKGQGERDSGSAGVAVTAAAGSGVIDPPPVAETIFGVMDGSATRPA